MQRLRLPEKTRVIRNIEYDSVEGKSLLLDIYIPEKEEGPLPLVVWIHGGGWSSGSKENCRPALLLLPYGYAVASISYRLTGIAKFPAQMEDCKSAVRFLRANAEEYNINPQRIGAWGSSAGGHLASMLGTAGAVKEFDRGDHLEFSSKVQAVCDYYGPSSLAEMPRRQHEGIANSPETRLIGEHAGDNAEKAAKASPITYAGKNNPPFFIVHGDSDKIVPVSQSEILYNALLKAGVTVQLEIIKGAGHGGPEFTKPEMIAKVASFFDKHLKSKTLAAEEMDSAGKGRKQEGGLLYFATYRERNLLHAISNPHIKGALFTIYWSEIEQAENIYSWKHIENLMEPWIKNGKKIALRIMWSSNAEWPDPAAKNPTPQWLIDKGASVAVSPKSKNMVPLMWDPVYKKHAERFILKLAEKFDGNPDILFIDITPGAETNPYRYRINNNEPEFEEIFKNTAASNGIKYSDKLWLITIKEYIDFCAASFDKTRLLVTLNRGSLNGRSPFMEIGSYCMEKGFMLGQNGIRGTSYINGSLWKKAFIEWSQQTPIYFEMEASTLSETTGSLMEVMKAAERAKCGYLGVYATDVLKGTKGYRSYNADYEEALKYGASVISH